MIFRKAAAGELAHIDGLMEIYNQINEIDVDEVGVGGAKNFFEAKVWKINRWRKNWWMKLDNYVSIINSIFRFSSKPERTSLSEKFARSRRRRGGRRRRRGSGEPSSTRRRTCGTEFRPFVTAQSVRTRILRVRY